MNNQANINCTESMHLSQKYCLLAILALNIYKKSPFFPPYILIRNSLKCCLMVLKRPCERLQQRSRENIFIMLFVLCKYLQVRTKNPN